MFGCRTRVGYADLRRNGEDKDCGLFEFDQYQRSCRGAPLARPERYRPLTGVAGLSFLWWGEHCIECADPDCYATCSLYQPRADGRCRRFVYGIRKNRRFRSLRGYGAEVAFKTWGKLEAEGNARIEPASVVLRRERWLALASRPLKALGRLGFALSGNPRWHNLAPDPRKLARRLQRRGLAPRRADWFLLEIYNPMPHPVNLQLAIRLGKIPADARPQALPPPFLSTLTLPCGYSRHRVEARHFRAITDSGLPFKVSLIPEAESEVRLVFLSLDFVAFAAAPASAEAPVKCLVLDLDGTLWEGTLIEGRGVRVREEMVRLIRALDARGILLSVASKNDFEPAWQALQAAGVGEYFLCPQIGWGPKSSAIRRIAERLNLGLDSFAFLDDSPFERAEVSGALPMVRCIPAEDAGALLEDPKFAGSDSSDSANRRQYYRDASLREKERSSWGDDYLGFLKSCEIELRIDPFQAGDLPRVSELVQRTNQLNFSGRRYAPGEVAGLAGDDRLDAYVLRCADRYGDYGTVGFALVRPGGEEVRVEDFMLSCRVQGRFIEQAFFAALGQMAGGPEARRLWVHFRAAERNRPALAALERMKFAWDEQGEGLVLDLDKHALSCAFITVAWEGRPLTPAHQRAGRMPARDTALTP